MEALKSYIAAKPDQPMRVWAARFGISRPYLHALIDGTRFPSLAVAKRIQDETGGAVPVAAWPNLNAVLQAVAQGGAA